MGSVRGWHPASLIYNPPIMSDSFPENHLSIPPTTRAIALVGFMGSGKSAVGAALAHSLRWEFHDLDTAIATAAGKSVPAIFADEGEAAFREREWLALQAALAAAAASQPAVLALGGGAFLPERNRELLQHGKALTIFLDAPLDVLWQRCTRAVGERPLARDFDSFQWLYQQRLPVYQMADLNLATAGKLPDEVASAIRTALGLTTRR